MVAAHSQPQHSHAGLRQALHARWPLPQASELVLQLLDSWDGPERGYHDLLHLTEVLDRLRELHPQTAHDATLVDLAAWFHDAVYDDSPDPEGRSAAWAERALSPLLPPEDVAEVVRLVLLTREHTTTADDVNGTALCDADLAILAAPAERYVTYLAGVRREYASVPDDLWVRGRGNVLKTFLEREHLFATRAGRGLWEADARRNARTELDQLRLGRVPSASDDADPQP